MFLEYKEKFCDTAYWDKAFDVAYEVKDQELSTKEIAVISFLKAIEYITSKPINEEKLDKMASDYAISIFSKSTRFSELKIAENVLINNDIAKAYKAGYMKRVEEG